MEAATKNDQMFKCKPHIPIQNSASGPPPKNLTKDRHRKITINTPRAWKQLAHFINIHPSTGFRQPRRRCRLPPGYNVRTQRELQLGLHLQREQRMPPRGYQSEHIKNGMGTRRDNLGSWNPGKKCDRARAQ